MACHAFDRLSFPSAHILWMELPFGRNLLNGLATAQRLKRESSFKPVWKILSPCHSRIHSFGWDTS
jgi:hypothetical protein